MVKITTPEVIPGTFYFPKAQPGWNGPGITERVVVLTIARVKAVNIRFITPQQTIIIIVHVKFRTRVSDTHISTPDWVEVCKKPYVYCTPCDSRRTITQQTLHLQTANDALSHGRRLVKLRHIM